MAKSKKSVSAVEVGLASLVGKPVLVRLVTHYYTGRLIAVEPQELTIEDASWITDTGRFAAALSAGMLSEIEPFPAGTVVLGRSALIDMSEWKHELPRQVKP